MPTFGDRECRPSPCEASQVRERGQGAGLTDRLARLFDRLDSASEACSEGLGVFEHTGDLLEGDELSFLGLEATEGFVQLVSTLGNVDAQPREVTEHDLLNVFIKLSHSYDGWGLAVAGDVSSEAAITRFGPMFGSHHPLTAHTPDEPGQEAGNIAPGGSREVKLRGLPEFTADDRFMGLWIDPVAQLYFSKVRAVSDDLPRVGLTDSQKVSDDAPRLPRRALLECLDDQLRAVWLELPVPAFSVSERRSGGWPDTSFHRLPLSRAELELVAVELHLSEAQEHIARESALGSPCIKVLGHGYDLTPVSLYPLDDPKRVRDSHAGETVQLSDDDACVLASLYTLDYLRENGPFDPSTRYVEFWLLHLDHDAPSFGVLEDLLPLEVRRDQGFSPVPDATDSHVARPDHPEHPIRSIVDGDGAPDRLAQDALTAFHAALRGHRRAQRGS